MPHGLRGRATGTKAITVRVEVGFPLRADHLRDGLLDEAIQHRRYPQRAGLAVALGDVHPSDRSRAIAPRLQLLADGPPVLFQVLGQFLDGHAVDARRAMILAHLLQRTLQVGAFQHTTEQRIGGESTRVGTMIQPRGHPAAWPLPAGHGGWPHQSSYLFRGLNRSVQNAMDRKCSPRPIWGIRSAKIG